MYAPTYIERRRDKLLHVRAHEAIVRAVRKRSLTGTGEPAVRTECQILHFVYVLHLLGVIGGSFPGLRVWLAAIGAEKVGVIQEIANHWSAAGLARWVDPLDGSTRSIHVEKSRQPASRTACEAHLSAQTWSHLLA